MYVRRRALISPVISYYTSISLWKGGGGGGGVGGVETINRD